MKRKGLLGITFTVLSVFFLTAQEDEKGVQPVESFKRILTYQVEETWEYSEKGGKNSLNFLFNDKVFVLREQKNSGMSLVVIDPELGFMARNRNYQTDSSSVAQSGEWKIRRLSDIDEEKGPQLELFKREKQEFEGKLYMTYEIQDKSGNTIVLFFDEEIKTNFNAVLSDFLIRSGAMKMPDGPPIGAFVAGYEINKDGIFRDTVRLNSRLKKPFTITIKQ